jgi:putative ABC transport system permease protein
MGIEIVKGRNFSRPGNPEDVKNHSLEFIVTENLVKDLGWKDPIGKRCELGTVVGVARNFHYSPLHRDVRGTFIIQPVRGTPSFLNVRLQGGRIRETIEALRSRWSAFAPGYPFAYSFLDHRFAQFYEQDQRQQKLAVIFSSLCLLISCLGLFALALFHIEQRTKEIGIRKAIGASSGSVALLLTRKFLFWVALANVFAWPLTFWAMRKWLDNFAFRTSITPGVFVLPAFLVLVIALATVCFHAVRAARANPVDSLRYE